MTQRTPRWLWMVPLLLLIAVIAVPQLDIDGLWYDELFSVNNAGGAQYGPPSLTWIYERLLSEDPYQAIGYSYLLGAWGSVLGWSELVGRTLSFLAALLGIALTYRAGRDISGDSRISLAAALVVGLSALTIHYAHETRAFTLVLAGSAGLLWTYHHLLHDKHTGSAYQAGFVLSGVVLLWSHYYASMLFIGLGAYHLLFARQYKNWWRVIALTLIVGVLFLPQLPVFLEGLTRYSASNVAGTALSAPEAIQNILYYIGNGLLPLTLSVLAAGTWHLFRQNQALRMPVLVSLFGLIALLVSNAYLNILEPSRLRYAIFIWPGLGLWVGAGIVQIARWLEQVLPLTWFSVQRAFLLLCLLWGGVALRASTLPTFTESIQGTEMPRMRTMTNILTEEGAAGDMLAFYNGNRSQAWYMQLGMEYVAHEIPMPWFFTASRFDPDESSRDWAQQRINSAERVWYGVNRTIPMMAYHRDFLLLLPNQGFRRCNQYVDNHELGLTLWARSYAFCPSENEVMTFDEGAFQLTGYEVTRERNTLQMAFGWQIADRVPPDTYSFGVYLSPENSDDVLRQADVGFPDVQFASLRGEFENLDDLPSGTYEIRLAVYEWRTGQRLTGVTADEVSGDYLLLDTLEIE